MENNQENKNIVIDNELQSKEASKDEAYSKSTHKICTHISQSAKEILDAILFLRRRKQQRIRQYSQDCFRST